MEITLIFLLGLVVSFIGVIPPGLLNMTAARISLKEGHLRGTIFSIGVCVTVAIQTWVAAIFSKYLSNHPEAVEILQRVGFVIFVLLTIYFLLLAKSQPKHGLSSHVKSKHSRFFQGIFLAGLNILPLPYQAYMITTMAAFGWMTFDPVSIGSYVAGAACGTFVMLYIYIFFFDKIKGRRWTTQKSMNYIIGTITGIVAVFTLVNIIKDW